MRQDEGDKVIVCERGDLVFVFNFNPSQSFSDYGVGAKNPGSYKVCLLPQGCMPMVLQKLVHDLQWHFWLSILPASAAEALLALQFLCSSNAGALCCLIDVCCR